MKQEKPSATKLAAAERSRLAAELATIVGRDGVIVREEELRVYECDALMAFTALPDLVVLPRDTAQVVKTVRLCHREGLPVVPRGAGTGLAGGALALEGGVMIAMNRMNAVLDVDIPNQRAVVQAGLVNLWLSERLKSDGYYYAPDPASQSTCCIGGNVGTNAGGVHTPKYGVTVHHVLGLEVVLPDGEVVELGGPTLDPPGYDLTGLFVGSEGTFGIATTITVRILRKPQAVKTLLAVFAGVEEASGAVTGIVGRGIIPACVEMMDQLAIQAVERGVRAGYPTDAGAVLLIELDGPAPEVEAYLAPVIGICREHGAREVRVAADDAERLLLWKGRKAAFAAMGHISPNYYVQDAVIPRTKLPQILGEIQAWSRKLGIRVANVFHAGDGNLHPLILYDARRRGEFERVEELAAAIMKRCIEVGGSITGEHGVGREKRDFMPLLFSADDLDAMRDVKSVFNPDGRFNPGKIFPTGTPCAEVRPVAAKTAVQQPAVAAATSSEIAPARYG